MKYRFSPAANRAQDEIWHYTLNRWGEKKAVGYLEGLHSKISEAVTNKKSWKKLDHPRFKSLYFIRYEKHYIFFRVLSDQTLGVINILHERMNLPERLKDQ